MKKSAFPIYVTGGPESGYHPGMTLREYYAGQVGPIFLQRALSVASLQNNGIVDDLIARGIKVSARDAVRWADALIAELEGGK